MKTHTWIIALVLSLTAFPLYTALEGQDRIRQMNVKAKKHEDAKKPADRRIKTVGGMEFVYIPGGSFLMGSRRSPEELVKIHTKHNVYPPAFEGEQPSHRVEVSAFWIGKYEVTQSQYEALMGTNPSYFKGDSLRPVEQVSWNDAKAFIEKFGAKYGVSARLPTEAEWEYAARAGTSTEYYWGEKMDGRYCWYKFNSNKTTHPAGKKRPNNWGLYDMTGNVWEWCEDWYDENYYSYSPKKNPKGPETGSSYRVVRGGSWYIDGFYLRCALRSWFLPGNSFFNLGFRVVLPSSGN